MGRTRVVIVRRDATELFESLQRRFAGDPTTRVIWDNRSRDRRSTAQSEPVDRRRQERRMPVNPAILEERGFFVTFAVQIRGARPRTATR